MTDYMHTSRRDNIRYDLLRTGNVELTSNKILEKGFLDAVSCEYTSYCAFLRICTNLASTRILHPLPTNTTSTKRRTCPQHQPHGDNKITPTVSDIPI